MKFQDVAVGEAFLHKKKLWVKTDLEVRHEGFGAAVNTTGLATFNAYLESDSDGTDEDDVYIFIPDNTEVMLEDEVHRHRAGISLGALLTAPIWLPILSVYLLWQKIQRAAQYKKKLKNKVGL